MNKSCTRGCLHKEFVLNYVYIRLTVESVLCVKWITGHTFERIQEELNMKKFLLAIAIAAVAMIAAPSSVKAASALTQAQDFYNMNNDWNTAQNAYFWGIERPVMREYDKAMAAQWSQATRARWQSDWMAWQAQQRAAVNAYQLMSNEYARQQNIATQYTNLKNMATYNAVNNWDTSFYNNQEMVLRTYAAMFGQYPFPQVQ